MRRAALVGVLLLAGCSWFGYQPATVSYPRDALWKRLGDVKARLGFAEGYGTALCELGRVPAEVCPKAKAVLDDVRALIAGAEEAALAKGEPVDLAALGRIAGPLLNQYATTLGPAAAKLAPLLLGL